MAMMGVPLQGILRGILIALVVGLLAACGEAGSPQIGSSDVTQTTLSDTELFAKRCRECHVPPRPQDFPAAEWPQIVQRMQMHRVDGGMDLLTQGEMQRIESYLQRNAKDAK